MLRNYKWEPSIIQPERRAETYSQKAVAAADHRCAPRATGRASRKDLEARLFEDGRVVYFLGIGKRALRRRRRHRAQAGEPIASTCAAWAEVANLMLDAGAILIVTAAELTQEDLEVIKTAVDPDRIETVWVGDTA